VAYRPNVLPLRVFWSLDNSRGDKITALLPAEKAIGVSSKGCWPKIVSRRVGWARERAGILCPGGESGNCEWWRIQEERRQLNQGV